MRTDDLDYHLPAELIATTPAARRDEARLLVAQRAGDAVEHRHVRDLPALLQPGDVLVINDTKVLPARFEAVRLGTGGCVEGLFLETRDNQRWHVLLESRGRLQPGERIGIGLPELGQLELLERQPDGSWFAALDSELDTEPLLDQVGAMPLPPYIRKQRGAETPEQAADRHRYQTVYASATGAVAAPTAGLHFTDALLGALRDAGIEIARLTLHVGMGTFQPVRADTLDDHDMHSERFAVPGETLDALRRARAEGRRIVPVGTTCVRALESLPDPLPEGDYAAVTRLLIQPGFTFRWTDALMTNFHLPRSTLLALVAALTGLDRLKQLYAIAIAERYRFYSYGDAMLVEC
jgi:S-adenosylmethionine:tRNA ribosyltransferase-isomerase